MQSGDTPGVTGPNEEQVAYWNEQAGAKWVRNQEALDNHLAPILATLLDALAARAGERIVDVGCGCGALTLEVARAVGPEGLAVGVDISEPMLARARVRASSHGLGQARFVSADAQLATLEPASFDALTSRFGVMFFADPAAAFANLRGGLRPGGRVVFACWQPLADNPWMAVPLAAAARHLELPAPPPAGSPGPFSLGDPDRLGSILLEAGFGDIELGNHCEALAIGGGLDLEESISFCIDMGPVAALLREADDAQLGRVRDSIRESLTPYQGDGAVALPSAVWLVSARNR